MRNFEIRHDIGRRDRQEDTYLAYQANEIKTEEQARAYLKGFHNSTLACTKDYEAGSCAISTVYLPSTKQVVWSNIGDSQATVFIYRGGSSPMVESKVLNALHNTSSGYILNHKHRELRVNRAYGDKYFLEFSNMGTEPFFSSEVDYGAWCMDVLNLQDGDRVFLMTSCDGYFAWDSSLRDYRDRIIGLLEATANATTEQVLEECFKEAKADSRDNLTAIMTEITPGKHADVEGAIVAQVFDGHGGAEVSKAIVENALKNIINDQSKFSNIESSEITTWKDIGFEVAKLAAIAGISFGANMLVNTSRNSFVCFIAAAVTPILCERYIHAEKMPFFEYAHNLSFMQMPLEVTAKFVLNYVNEDISRFIYYNAKVPAMWPTIAVAGFYMCNTYIAPALFSEMDVMTQAIISTAISVGIAVVTPPITNAIEIL